MARKKKEEQEQDRQLNDAYLYQGNGQQEQEAPDSPSVAETLQQPTSPAAAPAQAAQTNTPPAGQAAPDGGETQTTEAAAATPGVSPIEAAYQQYGEAIQQIGDNQQAAQQAAGSAYIDALNKESEALDKADSDFLNAMKANAQNNNNAFGDYVKKKLEDLEKSQKESDILDKEELKPAIWTNVAELANNIINLAGVSRGASNMQFQTFSQDWMKKADANRKERRRRIDTLKEKLDAAQLKLQDIKSSGAKSVAELQYKTEAAAAARAKEKAGVQYKLDGTAATAEAETAGKAAEARLKGEIAGEQAKKEGEELEMRRNYYGALAGRAGRTGSGATKNQNVSLALAADEKNNLPAEIFQIDEKTLLSTISANIDALTDLSEEDKAVIARLKKINLGGFGETEAKDMMAIAQRSPQLRALLRNAAKMSSEAGRITKEAEETRDTNDGDTGLGAFN